MPSDLRPDRAEPLWLVAPGQRPLAVWLGALMVASALTEGIGLVLLVPILGLLGQGGQGRIAVLLDRIGLPVALGPLLVLFVVLVLVRGAINLARGQAAMRLEVSVVETLRRRAWRALLQADWRALSDLRQSDSASLLITNVDRVGFGVNQLAVGLAAALTLAGLGLAALAIAPGVALGGALGGLVVLIAYRGMRRRAAELGEQLGRAYDAMHARLGESLAALRTIKSLGSEDLAEGAALAGFERLRQARLGYQRDTGLGQLALQGGGALVLALLVWLAVERGQVGASAVLPMVALFARALPLLGTVQEAWQNWAHARPAAHDALALIARAERAREPAVAAVEPPALTAEIALRNVTLQYRDQPRPALEQVSLTLPAGTITAIAGPSGAGKSTLADLLGGLIAPDAGVVLVDGRELDPPLRRAWRSRVAYVQQDPVLLADTIRANLLWAAPQAGPEAIERALRGAAADFVFDLPHGLDTRVGDGGRRLSGGERQRLMLARALLRDPALLILDEATSALDRANEELVARAVAAMKGQRTVLVIGHRGALAALADRRFQLDRGNLTDDGIAD